MTYHEKPKVEPEANPPVRPSGLGGERTDPDYAGWLCDADSAHVDWDKR